MCVDYAETFSLCLATNLKHFSDYIVCTHKSDTATIRLCESIGVRFFVTDAFYRDKAIFNKWLALEECLDVFGRTGQIALVDADIVFPDSLNGFAPDTHCIYTPVRRISEDRSIPPETDWQSLPDVRFAGVQEGWAGYTQIFNCDSPCVEQTPWHRSDYGHAGCSDTWFEERWKKEDHRRPPFEVLHLGLPFANWVGMRVSGSRRKTLMREARRGRRLRQ